MYPEYSFSQKAIKNINRLLKFLKTRLNNSGKTKSIDNFGNEIYVDYDIFSTESLLDFLCLSLSWFNSTPLFSCFTFEDDEFIDIFGDVIVSGALIQALGSCALLEKGREFTITDNGVSYDPPTVSELMNSQFSTMLEHHFIRLREIKKEKIVLPVK